MAADDYTDVFEPVRERVFSSDWTDLQPVTLAAGEIGAFLREVRTSRVLEVAVPTRADAAGTLPLRHDLSVANIRDYTSDDEQGWLRCRVLAFMSTAYFDDVATAKPEVRRGAELVAEQGGVIVGILDLVADGDLATIETVAVHPDFQREGVGSSLLGYGMERARALGAKTVDAWTRDDASTLAWYRAQGFAEDSHYLHVYADSYVDPEEPGRAVRPQPGLTPMKVFLHATLADEATLRKSFRRVHQCRRFARTI